MRAVVTSNTNETQNQMVVGAVAGTLASTLSCMVGPALNVETLMSFIVIVTREGAQDFEVVGAFEDRHEAVNWAAAAFTDTKYENCFFRIKMMRSKDNPDYLEPDTVLPGLEE